MKLKLKPTVYSRIDVLVKNSKVFQEEVQFIAGKREWTRSEKKLKEESKKLCSNFFIASTDEEEEVAIPLLVTILQGFKWDNVTRNIWFDEENESLHISIYAPLTSKGLKACLEEVDSLQENFIIGSRGKSPEELNAFRDEKEKRNIATGKGAERNKRFIELRKELQENYWGKYSNEIDFEKYIQLDEEFEKEKSKLAERSLFTESSIKQFDDNLEMFQLYLEHGDKWEDFLKKKLTIKYLKKQGKNPNASEIMSPHNSVSQIWSEYGLSPETDDEELKAIFNTNYSQRIDEFKKSMML